MLQQVPLPEQPFLALILSLWQRQLTEEGATAARGELLEPFRQPFVIANPVVGASFVGRDEIMRRLESLWAGVEQRPSVVLYGHRRMGKSSILQNLRGELFGRDTVIVDFNQQTYGIVPSTGNWLHNLALELHDAVARHRANDLPEPAEAEFCGGDPMAAFQRFLRQLESRRQGLRCIVTLDEFETIEQRIRKGDMHPELIDFLRGVITSQTWLTLVFAGLHTLQEMTHSYWNPLFGSVETVPVSFLSASAARRLLTAPASDFAIDWQAEALDRVYQLTGGQPYLSQLIGHRLVTRLNDQMFEQNVKREPKFSLTDLDEVLDDPDFYRTGSAYFNGVWEQIQSVSGAAGPIVQCLARLGKASARQLAKEEPKITLEDVVEALAALQRRDVVRLASERISAFSEELPIDPEAQWIFSVELMQRWLSARARSQPPVSG